MSSIADRIARLQACGGVQLSTSPPPRPARPKASAVVERTEAAAKPRIKALPDVREGVQRPVSPEGEAPPKPRGRSKTVGATDRLRKLSFSTLRRKPSIKSSEKRSVEISAPGGASKAEKSKPTPKGVKKVKLTPEGAAARREQTRLLLERNQKAFAEVLQAVGETGDLIGKLGGDSEELAFLYGTMLAKFTQELNGMSEQLRSDTQEQFLSITYQEYKPARLQMDGIIGELAGKLSEFFAQLKELRTALNEGSAKLTTENTVQNEFMQALNTLFESTKLTLLGNQVKALKDNMNSENVDAVEETFEGFREYFKAFQELNDAYIRCFGVTGTQVTTLDDKPLYFNITNRTGQSMRWQATTDIISGELHKYHGIFEDLEKVLKTVHACRVKHDFPCAAEATALEKFSTLRDFLQETLSSANARASIDTPNLEAATSESKA